MAVYRSVRNLDWALILVAVALAGLGILQIYSATIDTAWRGAWWKQGVYLCAGFFLMWLMTRIDYHTLLGQVPALYMISLGLLVLTPLVGGYVWGSKRWIPLGFGFKFQPSEFVKLVIVLLVARYVSELRSDRLDVRDLVKLGLLVGIPGGLVAAQPDLGTSLT
ncbi:MAG: FtsW/RodA/SpoVE family cell cycle protein, partial [Bryobacteraceae bacterium]